MVVDRDLDGWEIGQHKIALVTEDARKLGVVPVALLHAGRRCALGSAEYQRLMSAWRDRPVVTMEVQLQDGKPGMLKSRVQPDSYKVTKKEAVFLTTIGPDLKSQLPAQLQEYISLPEVVMADLDTDRPYILQKYIAGRAAGSIHTAKAGLLTARDVKLIADFTDYFHRLVTIETFRGAAPDIDMTADRWDADSNRKYEEILSREALLGPALEETGRKLTVAELRDLAREYHGYLAGEPGYLAAGDINASNIIKIPEGTLALVDWELPRLARNKFTDGAFLFTNLYTQPYLQAVLLRRNLLFGSTDEMYQDARLEVLLCRGADFLVHFQDVLQKATSVKEQEAALYARSKVAQVASEAFNKTGVWKI